jgi:hypothetical protein
MTLLLHAIVLADADRELDLPFVAVEAGQLRAYASEDAPDLQEHHRRVVLLHNRFSACLPARFGSRFADAETLKARLTQHQERLCTSLEGVSGRCELAVTAVWTRAPQQTEGGPGTRYLRERMERERIARETAESVEREGGAVSTRRTRNPQQGVALSMALLVDRDRAATVARQLHNLKTSDRVRILVNGPWPPYSFVGQDQREE